MGRGLKGGKVKYGDGVARRGCAPAAAAGPLSNRIKGSRWVREGRANCFRPANRERACLVEDPTPWEVPCSEEEGGGRPEGGGKEVLKRTDKIPESWGEKR